MAVKIKNNRYYTPCYGLLANDSVLSQWRLQGAVLAIHLHPFLYCTDFP